MARIQDEDFVKVQDGDYGLIQRVRQVGKRTQHLAAPSPGGKVTSESAGRREWVRIRTMEFMQSGLLSGLGILVVQFRPSGFFSDEVGESMESFNNQVQLKAVSYDLEKAQVELKTAARSNDGQGAEAATEQPIPSGR